MEMAVNPIHSHHECCSPFSRLGPANFLNFHCQNLAEETLAPFPNGVAGICPPTTTLFFCWTDPQKLECAEKVFQVDIALFHVDSGSCNLCRLKVFPKLRNNHRMRTALCLEEIVEGFGVLLFQSSPCPTPV